MNGGEETHPQLSRVLSNLASLFIVVKRVQKNERQVLVHTQSVLVLVLRKRVFDAV